MNEESTYAARLRSALERDGWSQLRLVRGLAERTGNAVDSERSAVRGYLKGNTPRQPRAKLIAEITGVPELAVVEDPRRSGAARLEDRLESIAEQLAANQAEGLQNQREALLGQQQILDELRALREALQLPGEAGRSVPTPTRRRAP